MTFTGLLNEITAARFYWTAHGIITGRCGHVYKGPQWTYWRGLREVARTLQRHHRGELKPWAPQSRPQVQNGERGS